MKKRNLRLKYGASAMAALIGLGMLDGGGGGGLSRPPKMDRTRARDLRPKATSQRLRRAAQDKRDRRCARRLHEQARGGWG